MAEIPVTELLQVLSANGTPLGDGIVPKSQGGRYIASGISVDATGQIKFDGYRSDRAFTGIATGIIGFTNDGRLVTLPLQQTSTASNSVSESEETMSSIENTLSFFSDNAGTLASSSILNDNGNYSVGGLSAFWKWDVNAGSINIDQSGNTLAGGADGYRINGKLVLSYNPISGELTIGNATYKTTNIQYLKSHSVAFNTDPVGIVVAPGVMSWNDTYGTVEIGLKGGNLTYRLGQSSMTYVKHADNSGLTKGTVIYPVGSDGSNKTVRLARADIEATSSKTFGVVAETVTGGGKAFCITEGLIEGINTSLLTEGSAVYLSPATAGGMTTTKPSAPNHMVLVGFCIKSHAVNGSIFVKVQNGFELDELHDVAISSLENNNLLAYEASTSLWKNKTFAELGLSSGTGTTNFVTKWSNATGGLTNSQVFDNGVNVGIGTVSPSARLHIDSTGLALRMSRTGYDSYGFVHSVGSGIQFQNFTDNVTEMYFAGNGNVGIGTTNPSAKMHIVDSNPIVRITSSSTFFYNDFGLGYIDSRTNTNTSAPFSIRTGGTDRLYIDANGNVGIGTATPSQKLTVAGNIMSTEGGTAALPKITLSANTTTGIYTPMANGWGVSTNGVSRLVINEIGNVGIGTTNPLVTADINGTNTAIAALNQAANGSVLIGSTGTSAGLNIGIFGGSYAFIQNRSRTGDGNAYPISLNPLGGNVGIGITTPSQSLHVFTATPYQIQVQRSGVGSALIGVSGQTPNSTGDLLFEGTQASQGFAFRSRDASNTIVNSLGIDRNGNVGIGTFSPSYRLDVAGGARFTNDVVIGGGAVGVNSLLVAKNITGGVDASGIRSSGQIQSDVTNSAFIYRAIVNQANFDLPTLIVYESQTGTVSGTGTLLVNFRAVANPTGFTNVYGFQGTIASGTNRWNLFMVGTAPNHMAGSLGIGTTAIVGHGIRNSKTITGGASGFSHANYSDGQIQSDVTGAAWYFRSFANTQPTAFTLPEIRHFDATQGTIGAGSSVTVQTAFLAGSTLVGASFANYGFRGSIPAGTGRWNAFMDGTAQNYFRGNVGIGINKTVPAVELDVAGTIATTNFRMTSGAAAGRVLQSDANGNASWVTLNTSGYLGTWNANTNTPTIADGTGTAGQFYIVTVAGTWNSLTFAVGDQVYYNGTIWQRIPSSFTLPVATASVLGGVKISTGLTIDGTGNLSVSYGTTSTTSATGDHVHTFGGDVSGSGGTGTIALTLATVNSNVGQFTKVTVNAKGLVTAATNLIASDIPTLNQNTTGSAGLLATARNIAMTGDGTWSVSFNGSADVSGVLTLANVVTPETYRSVTVNSKGIVTAGTNPTTVSGYGITDFYSQIVSGFVTGENSTVLNTDSLEVALEKLQGQINARISGNQTITLSGIVTGSGTTAITTAIADAALSIAKTSGLQTALDGKFATPTGLTTNFVSKWDGSVFANSQIFDNGTSVGIAITSVSSTSKLHVNNAVGNSVRFQNTYFSNSVESGTGFARGGIFNNAEYIEEGGVKVWKIRNIGANDAAGILFGNSGTLNFISVPNTGTVDKSLTHAQLLSNTRITILATGFVGVNTTEPTHTFDVLGTTRTTNLLITSGATNGNFLKCNNVNGTSVWSSITTSDISNLSSWAGSTSITTLGTITAGTWNGTAIATTRGGTGLSAIGTANQMLRVNAGATALEYFTPTFISGNQTISITGDATGSGTTSIALTLANVATAGTYRSVTINNKGLVTSGTNPTTLAGYAITDAYTKTESDGRFVALAGSYANPTWITSLAWSKLSGVPATFAPSAHTHAASDITSGVIATARLASGTASATTYLRGDQTWATLPAFVNQTITLSGIVTGSGTTAITTAIADAALSIAKTSGLQTALDSKQATLSGTGLVLSTAGTITYVTNNSANWNTAFGWGNHASAGYLLASTASTTYQPLDADLTSIAGLAGTSGILRKTAANTWSLDTNSYLTANQTISITGDATGSGTTSIALTLANSGVTANTYRSVTVNSKGLVTAGTNPTTLAEYGITDAYTKTESDARFVLTSVLYSNPTWITSLAWSKLTGVPATFAPSAHTHAASDITSGVIATARLASGTASATTYLRGDQTWATLPAFVNQTITLSGIVTGSGTTAITTAIADNALSIAKTSGLQTALNSKQATLNGTGFVKASGTTISYDNTSYQPLLPSGNNGQFLVRNATNQLDFMNLVLEPQGLSYNKIAVGDNQNYLSEQQGFEFREESYIAIYKVGSNPIKAFYAGMYSSSNNSFITASGGSLTLKADNGFYLDGFTGSGNRMLAVDTFGRIYHTDIPTGGGGTAVGTLDQVLANGNSSNRNIILNYGGYVSTDKLQFSGESWNIYKRYDGGTGTGIAVSTLSGTGTRMVVADANGVLSTQLIPSGSGSTSLAATQIAFGSGSNSVTSSSNFIYSNDSIIMTNNSASNVNIIRINGQDGYDRNIFFAEIGGTDNGAFVGYRAGVNGAPDPTMLTMQTVNANNVMGGIAIHRQNGHVYIGQNPNSKAWNSSELNLNKLFVDGNMRVGGNEIIISGSSFKLSYSDFFGGTYAPANGDKILMTYDGSKGSFVMQKIQVYTNPSDSRNYLTL